MAEQLFAPDKAVRHTAGGAIRRIHESEAALLAERCGRCGIRLPPLPVDGVVVTMWPMSRSLGPAPEEGTTAPKTSVI
ncbi:MAG: hypothetical protein C0404_11735 [Verrucomicrobia bacterium]|nr:hypothetical protein [Verrucomicrobiota bacterium]